MKILITGGAGYIGTILTEQLLQHKEVQKVYALDNLMYKQDGVISFCANPKYNFVYGDVRDTKLLTSLVEKVDVIFPLAALVGFPACDRDPRTAKEVNFDHVDFIAKHSRGHVIYPNSNSGYGMSDGQEYCTEDTPLNPISVYGKTKCRAEKSILDNGQTSLRLATVFGTSYRFRKDLLVNDFTLKAVQDGYIVLFESHFKRNFIHIRDVVKTLIHMIEYKSHNFEACGEAYNVGLSDANLSKLQLCQLIKNHIPNFDIKTSDFNSDPDKRNYIVSNAKLEATGWIPEYSLDDGIIELIKAYKILINTDTSFTNL